MAQDVLGDMLCTTTVVMGVCAVTVSQPLRAGGVFSAAFCCWLREEMMMLIKVRICLSKITHAGDVTGEKDRIGDPRQQARSIMLRKRLAQLLPTINPFYCPWEIVLPQLLIFNK